MRGLPGERWREMRWINSDLITKLRSVNLDCGVGVSMYVSAHWIASVLIKYDINLSYSGGGENQE